MFQYRLMYDLCDWIIQTYFVFCSHVTIVWWLRIPIPTEWSKYRHLHTGIVLRLRSENVFTERTWQYFFTSSSTTQSQCRTHAVLYRRAYVLFRHWILHHQVNLTILFYVRWALFHLNTYIKFNYYTNYAKKTTCVSTVDFLSHCS